MSAAACTCGQEAPHILWKRETADGYTVYGWSDGIPRQTLGYHFRGVDVAREAWAADADRTALDALAGLVCTLDVHEVAAAFQRLRHWARLPCRPGTGWRWPRGYIPADSARRIAFRGRP